MQTPRINQSDRSWLYFFVFFSWFAGAIMILSGLTLDMRLQSVQKKFSSAGNEEIAVLLETRETNEFKNQDKKHFLSDKNADAAGQLTKKKGFQSPAADQRIEIPSQKKSTDQQKDQQKRRKKPVDKILLNEFPQPVDNTVTATIQYMTEDAFSSKNQPNSPDQGKKYALPMDYKFNREFAFSWDKQGYPVIPTYYFKHYEYISQILNKIRQNWAPPGGIPANTYGDSYHASQPIPGRNSFRAFSAQEISLYFIIDEQGYFREGRILKSRGDKSLDESIMDAIRQADYFGPPPRELLENGQFIFQLILRVQ